MNHVAMSGGVVVVVVVAHSMAGNCQTSTVHHEQSTVVML